MFRNLSIAVALVVLFFSFTNCDSFEIKECSDCNPGDSVPADDTSSNENPPIDMEHLKYFGFALVDTFYDDPKDSEVKSSYIDEVKDFSNLADTIVMDSTHDVTSNINNIHSAGMKAYIHLFFLLFERVDSSASSGNNYDIRPDALDRWNSFVSLHQSVLTQEYIGGFYIGEEPFWNGVTFDELKLVTDHIKSEFPEIPIIVIEAHPALDMMTIPKSVDWVGFDRYGVKDPLTDPTFLSDLDKVYASLSSPDQRILLIMDTHFIPEFHGDYAGLKEENMKDVATSYFELALLHKKVIGLIGYTWPGGLDHPNMLGARQLSTETQKEYSRIGKLITGKMQ